MQLNVRFRAYHARTRLCFMNEPRFPSNGPNVAGEGTTEKPVDRVAASTGLHHPSNPGSFVHLYDSARILAPARKAR